MPTDPNMDTNWQITDNSWQHTLKRHDSEATRLFDRIDDLALMHVNKLRAHGSSRVFVVGYVKLYMAVGSTMIESLGRESETKRIL